MYTSLQFLLRNERTLLRNAVRLLHIGLQVCFLVLRGRHNTAFKKDNPVTSWNYQSKLNGIINTKDKRQNLKEKWGCNLGDSVWHIKRTINRLEQTNRAENYV